MLPLEYLENVHRFILSDVVQIQIPIKGDESNTLLTLIFISIFIFNLLTKLVTLTQKTAYQSRNEKETSASKETTSSISYRKLVSRRKRGAYSNTYGNPIK